MKLNIVAVGKIKEGYFREAIDEYVKRAGRFANLQVVEVEECTFNGIPNDAQIEKILAEEGKNILKKVEGYVVALCIDGNEVTSVGLCDLIEKVSQTNSTITFVIGGSHGLSQEVRSRADKCVSLGRITMPHQLCRVVLTEQIYRALTIKNNVPYHK